MRKNEFKQEKNNKKPVVNLSENHITFLYTYIRFVYHPPGFVHLSV